ncbi:hypothetical protein ACFE04_008235 [Oxalis oulophora]
MAETSTMHIGALAFPFGTHASPLLNLIRRMSQSYPDAKFSFFSTEQSNNKLLSGIEEINNSIKHYNVSDGLPEGYVFKGNPEEPVEYFLRPAQVNFKQAMEEAEAETGRKLSCLISDSFLWFVSDMAEEMNIPWISLWVSGPCALYLHLATEYIREQMANFDGPADRPLDFLPEYCRTKAEDLPEGIITARKNSVFSEMLHNMERTLFSATSTVINSFEELDCEVTDAIKSKIKKYLNLGPFILTSPKPKRQGEDQNCLDWLDQHKPASVVYISFGSVIQLPPLEIVALSEALEETKVPFLWSFYGDQQSNKQIIENVWKFGVGIEGNRFTKEGTIKALQKILFSDEGEKMRERILAKKDLSLKAVEEDGSSTRNFNTLLQIINMPR